MGKVKPKKKDPDDFTGEAGKQLKARMAANKKAGALDDFTGEVGKQLKAKMKSNKKAGALDDFTGEAGKQLKAKMKSNRLTRNYRILGGYSPVGKYKGGKVITYRMTGGQVVAAGYDK